MEEVIKNLSSTSWWFGVVFVGILVSLIASYVKPYLDKWLSNYSKSRKDRNEKEEQEWNAEVERLVREASYRNLFASRITHAHGRSSFFMLAGLSMFLMGGVFSLFFQLPDIIPNDGGAHLTKFMASLPEEKIIFFIRLFLSGFGSLCLLIGMSYFKTSEMLQKQLEDSVEEMANNPSQPGS